MDELDQCNELLGKEKNYTVKANRFTDGTISLVHDGKPRKYFPFRQNDLFVATLRVGSEGIQMTVDGKHITSFAFREVMFLPPLDKNISKTLRLPALDDRHLFLLLLTVQTLEPWLVNEVRISGDINLISVVASGLPTSEDLEHIVDLKELKAVPIPPRKQLNLFVGIFSTANNFKRRMAVRRSWMQYPEVRSGHVAVRFFVGLVCSF